MSADVHDLTGDKTMNASTNVKLANDDVYSACSTVGTWALTEVNGASEMCRRPHAPRSSKPKNAALTGLHFDISSTSEVGISATRELRLSVCARPNLRLLDRIRVSYRRRIGKSPTDHVSQIHGPIWSREGTSHSSNSRPGLLRGYLLKVDRRSIDSHGRHQLVAYCRPKSTQLRSKMGVDYAQTNSNPGPIPLVVHRIAFTTLQLVPTMTPVPKQLSGSENDRSAHQIRRNKS
jgi:hypothetical protein